MLTASRRIMHHQGKSRITRGIQINFLLLLVFIEPSVSVPPEKLSAPTISSVTDTSFRVNFTSDSNATNYFITITPRYDATTPVTVNTANTSVVITNLIGSTLYDVTVKAQNADGEIGVDGDVASEQTHPEAPAIRLMSSPLPNSIFVFPKTKNYARVSQWVLEYRISGGEASTNVTTVLGQYYVHWLTNLVPDTEYQIRARASQISSTTNLDENEVSTSPWKNFTTDSLSVFGRVNFVNATFTNRTEGSEDWNSALAAIQAAYESIPNNGINIVSIEQNFTVHYEIKVKEKSLPSSRNYSLLTDSQFQNVAINNGGESNGTAYYIYPGGDEDSTQFDTYYFSRAPAADAYAGKYMVISPEDSRTFEHFMNAEADITESNNYDKTESIRFDGTEIIRTDNEAVATVPSNTVVGLVPKFLVRDYLKNQTQLLTDLIYVATDHNDESDSITSDHFFFTTDFVIRLTNINYTTSCDGLSVTLDVPAIEKAIKYEILNNSVAIATVDESDIDGSTFIKITAPSPAAGTDYFFKLQVTVRNHNGTAAIVSTGNNTIFVTQRPCATCQTNSTGPVLCNCIDGYEIIGGTCNATTTTQEPTTQSTTTQEPTTQSTTTQQPTTQSTTTHEPTTQSTTTQEPTTQSATTQEPTTQSTTTQEPTTQSATTQEPTTQSTTTQEPTTQSTTTQEPNTQSATTQEPTTQSTTTQEPTTQSTTTQEPTTQSRTTQEPTTQSTTTQEPTTQSTTTQEPTTQLTTTQEPSTLSRTTQEPTTQSTTNQQPTTQLTTTQEPTTQSRTTQEPTTQSTTNQQPTSQSTTTQEPTTLSRTTQEPTTQSTTNQQPSTQLTTTQEPTTQSRTTQEPTTQSTTNQQPTTQLTTTQEPTTQSRTTQEPTTQSTTNQQPTTQLTTTQEPTTQSRTTQEPTTQSTTNQLPTTQLTTTQEPTTQSRTTQEPTTQSTTNQQPTSQSTTTQEPTTLSRTTQEPTTQSTTNQQPSTQLTTTQEPTTQSRTTQEPTTQSTTNQQPTTQLTTTQEPTTQSRTTQEPTTQSTTNQQPTTQLTTTQEPTTQSRTTQEPTTQSTTNQQLTTQSATTQEPTTQSITTQESTAQPITTESTSQPITTAKTTTHPTTSRESPAQTTGPVCSFESDPNSTLNLQQTEVDETYFSARWANITTATDYLITLEHEESIKTERTTSIETTFRNLIAGQAYNICVTLDQCISGKIINKVECTTLYTVPAAVTNVTTEAAETEVNLSWLPSVGALAYEVNITIQDSTARSIPNSESHVVKGTSHSISNLKKLTRYSTSIRAKNSAGYSAPHEGTFRTTQPSTTTSTITTTSPEGEPSTTTPSASTPELTKKTSMPTSVLTKETSVPTTTDWSSEQTVTTAISSTMTSETTMPSTSSNTTITETVTTISRSILTSEVPTTNTQEPTNSTTQEAPNSNTTVPPTTSPSQPSVNTTASTTEGTTTTLGAPIPWWFIFSIVLAAVIIIAIIVIIIWQVRKTKRYDLTIKTAI